MVSHIVMRTPSVRKALLEALAGCGKTMLARENFDGPTCGTTAKHSRRMLKKAAQQGRSKRRGDAYFVRYGEPLREARTPLEACFSILLLLALAGCVPSPSSVEAIREDSVNAMWNGIIWSVRTRRDWRTSNISTVRVRPLRSAQAPKARATTLVHCMEYRASTQSGYLPGSQGI